MLETTTKKSREITDLVTLLFIKQKPKALTRLRRCAGWSTPCCLQATQSGFLTIRPICIRESPSQFENRIMPRVYIKSITRSTMYQKAPFC